jgi:hypothetical protein
MEIPCDLDDPCRDGNAVVRLVDDEGHAGFDLGLDKLRDMAHAAFVSVAIDEGGELTPAEALRFYIAPVPRL